MFKSLMKGLAEKGHTVHVVSHYPLEVPVENYTDFSLAGSIPLPNNQKSLKYFEQYSFDLIAQNTFKILHSHIQRHEDIMKSNAIQRLMESEERYDLIITESFSVDVTLGFVNKFQVPFIFVTSSHLPPWTSSLVANPQNPSFVPGFVQDFSPRMTFVERLLNTLGLFYYLASWHWFNVPDNQRLIHKYFGSDTPHILDIYKNVSLILTNSHSSITGSRPFLPNVIEVGGIHIKPPKQLPKDIKDFIESAPHGVVYFSLGSMIRAATLSEQKKNAFTFAFSQLKERVLWKFEEESIATNENIMIRKWMPQRDILAHPKVKMFISHCGLLGVQEAVSGRKPILGIPLTADQWRNCLALELKGYAKVMAYRTIDNKTMLRAMQEVLEPEYADRAKQISEIFYDRPMTPMDTATYWVEYVIRNKGAKHLRTSAVDLPFYQYLLLDVVIFIISCVSTATYLIYYALKRIVFNRMSSQIVKTKLS
uniref:UDP-gluconosyltransferase n=1 Tax=Trialeurodes vaporariorum TaxID=88556 RepID=A0A873P528_TRIVP|nr:UDP-gluconosyltransferase [Trialeurodes vaporariorum]